jgi:hypothetical protein
MHAVAYSPSSELVNATQLMRCCTKKDMAFVRQIRAEVVVQGSKPTIDSMSSRRLAFGEDRDHRYTGPVSCV